MATFTNPGSRVDLLLTLARLSFPDAVRRANQPVAVAILIAVLFLAFATVATLGLLPVLFTIESDGLRRNLLNLIACSITALGLLAQVALRAPVTWAARSGGPAAAAGGFSRPVRAPSRAEHDRVLAARSRSRRRLSHGHEVGRGRWSAGHVAGHPESGLDLRPSGGDPVASRRPLGRRCARHTGHAGHHGARPTRAPRRRNGLRRRARFRGSHSGNRSFRGSRRSRLHAAGACRRHCPRTGLVGAESGETRKSARRSRRLDRAGEPAPSSPLPRSARW